MPTTEVRSLRGAQVIVVAAGIIWNPERTELLLTLRKPEQHQGDRWEFPGGKVESDETVFDGLCRELEEELGLRVVTAEPCISIPYDYPDKSVVIHFWHVLSFDGNPLTREGQQKQWAALSSLQELNFPEANKPVVDHLLENTPPTGAPQNK